MNQPDNWQKIKNLFHEVMDLPGDARGSFLEKHCGEDTDLFHQVLGLMDSDERAQLERFMVNPAFSLNSDDDMIQIMQDHPKYEMLQLIGRGGMATVYLAHDKKLNRNTALKFITMGHPELLKRFEREARAQAKVEHDHICKIYETDVWKGQHFIAMQYLPGKHLTEFLENQPIERKVQMVRDVANALHAAHSAGLIHRDLKPSNIIVVLEDDQPKSYLTDFGIALDTDDIRKTKTVSQAGTPAFMAPEQIQGDSNEIDRRTDIYGLGATLYLTLVDALPFDGESSIQVMFKVVESNPTPLRKIKHKIPKDLEIITMKCLEKDPTQRYQTAKMLAEELDRFLRGDPILGKGTTYFYRFKKRLLQHRLTSALVTLALILALGFGWFAVRSKLQAREQLHWVQKFGQEMSSLQNEIHIAHLYPLHDLTAEREKTQKQLDWIQHQIDQSGDLVSGPGHYALAQGFLALGDYETALSHFKRVHLLGYTPSNLNEVHGHTLGLTYLQKLEKARDIANPGVRESEILKLSIAFREPAVTMLSQSQPFESILEKVFFAFLSEQDLTKYTLPGPNERLIFKHYEDYLMWTSIILDQASRLSSSGEFDQAKEGLSNSETFLDRLSNIGRSDPSIYYQKARVQLEFMKIDVKTGNDPTPHYQKLEESVALSLQIEPTASRHLELQLEGDYIFLNYRSVKSMEYETLYQKALARAKQAGSFPGGEEPEAFHKARLLKFYGKAALDRGIPAEAYLEEAVSSLDKFLISSPDSIRFLALKASIHETYADILSYKGNDAEPQILEMIGIFKLLHQSNPQSDQLLQQLGSAYFWLGYASADKKRLSAIDSLHSALQYLGMAKEKNSNNFYTWNGLGMARGVMGNLLLKEGQDSHELFTGSLQAFQEVLRIFPNLTYSISNMGLAHHDLWRHACLFGEDPQPHYQNGIKRYEEAIEVSPSHEAGFLGALDLHLDEMQRRLVFKQDCSEQALAIKNLLVRYKAQLNKDVPDSLLSRYELLKELDQKNGHLDPKMTKTLRKRLIDSEATSALVYYFWSIRGLLDERLKNEYLDYVARHVENPDYGILVCLEVFLDPKQAHLAEAQFAEELNKNHLYQVEYAFLYQDPLLNTNYSEKKP